MRLFISYQCLYCIILQLTLALHSAATPVEGLLSEAQSAFQEALEARRLDIPSSPNSISAAEIGALVAGAAYEQLWAEFGPMVEVSCVATLE